MQDCTALNIKPIRKVYVPKYFFLKVVNKLLVKDLPLLIRLLFCCFFFFLLEVEKLTEEQIEGKIYFPIYVIIAES